MNRKTILLLLTSLIGGFSTQGFSQDIPKGINYQAVARDAQGKELANKNISVRFSLIKESDGTTTWVETQNITTDQFGLFNLTIGEGSPELGSEVASFDEIDWGAAHYSLKVEVDLGSGFRHVGTMPFLSVPYALYAAKSGNDSGSDSDNQCLIWDPVNQHITIENGEGMVNLSNYMQTLTVDGRNLSISNGNSVLLPADSDTDPTNELQVLSLDKNVLSIKQGNTTTNSVTFNFNDADADSTNELQNLSIVNHTLYLSKGNTITLPSDIQDLVLNDSVLSLSGDPTPTSINLNAFDNQQLHVDAVNNKLSIDNGNKIDIDASSTNEIQDLTLAGNQLSISKDPTPSSVIDLSKYQQSLTISNNQLTISGSNTIDLKQSLFGFRALAESTLPISANDSTTIQFKSEQLDYGLGFDANSGIFTVPANGEGLYQFSLSYNYSDNQVIRLVKNENILETLQKFNSYNFMLYLYPGDQIYLRLVNTITFGTIGIGSFMAAKVNQ